MLTFNRIARENPKKFLEQYYKAWNRLRIKWVKEGGKEWEIGFVTGTNQGHLDYWYYINSHFKNKTPEECLKIFKELKPSTEADYLKLKRKK